MSTVCPVPERRTDHSDWGCLLYLIGVPFALGAIASGHGDWIVGAVTILFIAVILIVTVGELVGNFRRPRWLPKRQSPPGAGPEGD